MLYATTRSDRDVYTAQRALTEDRAPDGGFYVPFRETRFSAEQLQLLEQKTVLENISAITSLLFKTRLSPWDVEFSIGRKPLRLEQIGRRTIAGERWRNTQREFSCLARNLCDRVRLPGTREETGIWAQIAAGIGSLFGLFALLQQSGFRSAEETVDVAAEEEDLTAVVSAWFARSWGLPVGRILCGCREGSALWELQHSGQLRTGLFRNTMPRALELLIYCCGGHREVQRLLEASEFGSIYKPGEGTLRRLRQGLFVSVVSERRICQTVASVYSAHHYLMNSRTVLPYAALLDYRAETGESGWGLILADRSPETDVPALAAALGITEQAVKDRLKEI